MPGFWDSAEALHFVSLLRTTAVPALDRIGRHIEGVARELKRRNDESQKTRQMLQQLTEQLQDEISVGEAGRVHVLILHVERPDGVPQVRGPGDGADGG